MNFIIIIINGLFKIFKNSTLVVKYMWIYKYALNIKKILKYKNLTFDLYKSKGTGNYKSQYIYTIETKHLGLLDYKDWALDAIVGKKDFLNLSVRHLKSDTWFLLRNS